MGFNGEHSSPATACSTHSTRGVLEATVIDLLFAGANGLRLVQSLMTYHLCIVLVLNGGVSQAVANRQPLQVDDVRTVAGFSCIEVAFVHSVRYVWCKVTCIDT